jgi:hypothetical protein
MANVTFSNKGIPMGRNKSVAVNANSHWSAEEDNFLRMAAAQNMTTTLVASKLGRTPASVYTRKWQLDIQNDKAMPRIKAPKTAKVVRTKTAQPVKVPKGVQLFQLESGIPIPSRGSRGNEHLKMQIRSTFNRMEIGNSFVINKEALNSTVYIAKNEFGAYRIKTSATSAEKKFFRIFRVA